MSSGDAAYPTCKAMVGSARAGQNPIYPRNYAVAYRRVEGSEFHACEPTGLVGTRGHLEYSHMAQNVLDVGLFPTIFFQLVLNFE